MPKKTPPTETAVSRRQTLGAIDPVMLLELIENRFSDVDVSPYRKLYAQSRETFLDASGQEAVHFAALLQSVDAAVGVEDATRSAGFIVGFECCRRLMLGELDFEALKTARAEASEGGAR